MKRIVAIAAAFILSTISATYAQPFLVSASVDNLTMTGGTATFTLQVIAEVEFRSTIYLSVSTPTLPLAQVSVAPVFINAPYTDVATVTLTLTGPKTGGTHKVIVKAANGSAAVYDTVAVTIPNTPSAWRVFTSDRIGGKLHEPSQEFVLDKKKGVGYFSLSDNYLSMYDGATWKRYVWPESNRKPRTRLQGMTIDSSRTLWAIFERMIIKWDRSMWKIIDTADASSGLTNEMLKMMETIHTASDGSVWITGYGKSPGSPDRSCLWMMQYSGSTWKVYNDTNMPSFGKGGIGPEFLPDHDGNIWLSGWADTYLMVKYDGTYWTTYSDSLCSHLGIAAKPRGVDYNGSVWFGQNSLMEFNGDSTTYYPGLPRVYTPQSNIIDSSYFGNVETLDFAPNGEAWVGMRKSGTMNPGGIARRVGTTWYHYTVENSGLPDNEVLYLSVDDAGNPWILTADGSLTLLDGSAPPESAFYNTIASVMPITGAGSITGAGHISIMPNPASSQATLRLHVPASDHVRVRLVNSLGQQVAVLLDDVRSVGDYSINVPLEGLTAGTYFVQVTGGGIAETCPLIVAE